MSPASPETAPFPPAAPYDAVNRELITKVHPQDHVNPTPPDDGPYHLVVIGGGTAGLVAAAGAAGLGAKVALVERELLGGDCLNVGCVPSKSLLAAAAAARGARGRPDLGVTPAGEPTVDFARVMHTLRETRNTIADHDSVATLRGKGVDVYLGTGRFGNAETVRVVGPHGPDVDLTFKHAVLATGGRARLPDIDGLADVGPLTNAPDHLAVLGAGPIGCELAQAFAALGVRVTLVHTGERIMQVESPECSALVHEALVADGVDIHLGTETTAARRNAAGDTVLSFKGRDDLVCSHLLVAAGRTPNVGDLGLHAAGIEHDARHGITVDDHLRTSHPRVYAAGDCAGQLKFTHAADAQARIIIRGALFPGEGDKSGLVIPWCTYTAPEVARVGQNAAELDEAGVEFDHFRTAWSDVDRAVCEGETAGFAECFVKQGTDELLGACVVGPHAGDLLAPFVLAMTHGLGLGQLAGTVFPYPTRAEVARKLGDAYRKTTLSPMKEKLLHTFLNWTR